MATIKLRSVQGETQDAISDTLWATDDAISEWLDTADEGDIICRERVRHGYRRVRRGERLNFVGRTKSGLFIRRQLCPDCRKVELVEMYLLKARRGTKNVLAQAERVASYPNYLDRSYLGKPGEGRKKPSKIRDMIVTKAMEGIDIRELEREVAEYEAAHAPEVYSAS